MSITNLFDITGSAMSAQSIRMNTIASNIANAQTVAGSAEEAYKARHPVFVANTNRNDANLRRNNFNAVFNNLGGADEEIYGVTVSEIVESNAVPEQRYQPSHPMANDEGYVFLSNVNIMEEMADMIATSRAFQVNVEMANTAKSMMQRLLTLGQ